MIEFTIPLKIVSEANMSEHWTTRSKRRKLQNIVVQHYLNKYEKPSLPCTVTLTRLGTRQLDFVNYIAAFKSYQDYIADWLIPGKAKGQADGDPRITWQFEQEIAKSNGFRIRIV